MNVSLSELLKGLFVPTDMKGVAGIPLSEVQKHTTKDSCWVILHDNVYDLTAFLADHPGGDEVILKWAGKDATKFWSAIHKKEWIVEYIKDEWCLGPVGPEPKINEDAALKAIKEENAKLKAELMQLKAAPTKPSAGLQDAMQAASKGREKGPEPDKGVASAPNEIPRVQLKGRKVVVV